MTRFTSFIVDSDYSTDTGPAPLSCMVRTETATTLPILKSLRSLVMGSQLPTATTPLAVNSLRGVWQGVIRTDLEIADERHGHSYISDQPTFSDSDDKALVTDFETTDSDSDCEDMEGVAC